MEGGYMREKLSELLKNASKAAIVQGGTAPR